MVSASSGQGEGKPVVPSSRRVGTAFTCTPPRIAHDGPAGILLLHGLSPTNHRSRWMLGW